MSNARNLSKLSVDSNGDVAVGSLPSALNVNASAPADSLAINASGQIGVGTTTTNGQVNIAKSGGNQLSLIDSSGSSPGIRFANSSNTAIAFIEAPAGNGLSFFSASTERMRIDSSGNVGIGTSSPAAKLQAVIGSGASVGVKYLNAGGSGLQFYTDSTASNADTYIESPLTGVAMIFKNGGSERMRIDSSGNLLVGTTSTSPTSGVGTKILGGNVSVVNTGQDGFDFYNTTAGAYRFYVQANGTIAATNTTISAISDQRFKENIRDLNVGLAEIMQLRPRVFDWKEGKGKNTQNDRGFIAQEVEQVFPDLIDEWKDPAPEGEEPYKSVRQDLIPVLVKAIQELKAENDALKSRLDAVEALEARIAALEAA